MSELLIHNSLTGAKEPFVPMQPGRAQIYVCGMTVYDYCHLGHARMLIAFDTIVRHLRALGLDVTYVRNITDIDDKIIKRAAELGEDIDTLTGRYIAAMHEDCAALRLEAPDLEPRATRHMTQIVAMIERLIERGHAYAADNGDVYYAVGSFQDYGKLSRKRMDELRIGARIRPDEAKRDALDFVLWKAAKPGEPQWESPWGLGRPGWHIECSAMSTHCLGDNFDLHGGGMDLKFPHHENEIAQSEGATGSAFANAWLHNGFVNVGEEKMSKSLGNFCTIRELLGHYSGEEIRFFVIGTHYRSPLAYTEDAMQAAVSGLRRLYGALDGVAPDGEIDAEAEAAYTAAMNDDFNTARAIAVLFDLARELNAAKSAGEARAPRLASTLKALGARLGLLQDDPASVLKGSGDDDAAIDALVAARNAARANKDWAEADRIRDQLAAEGIKILDGAAGSSWQRER